MAAWEVVGDDSTVLARVVDTPLLHLWADILAMNLGARVEFVADDVELFSGTMSQLADLTIRGS